MKAPGTAPRPPRAPTPSLAARTLKAVARTRTEPRRTAEALAFVCNTANAGAIVKIPIAGTLGARDPPGRHPPDAELTLRFDHAIALAGRRRRATIASGPLAKALHKPHPRAQHEPITADAATPSWGTLTRPARGGATPRARIETTAGALARALATIGPATDTTRGRKSWNHWLGNIAFAHHRAGTAPALTACNGELLAMAWLPEAARAWGPWCADAARPHENGIMIPAHVAAALAAITAAIARPAPEEHVRISRSAGERLTIAIGTTITLTSRTITGACPDWQPTVNRHRASDARHTGTGALHRALARTEADADARDQHSGAHSTGLHRRAAPRRIHVTLADDSVGLEALDAMEQLTNAEPKPAKTAYAPARAAPDATRTTTTIDREWLSHCIGHASDDSAGTELCNAGDNQSLRISNGRCLFVIATITRHRQKS